MSQPNAPAATPVRIAAWSGSARPGSFTRRALDVAVAGAKVLGAEVTVIDLGEWKLPPFGGEAPEQGIHPEVHRLKELVRSVDGFLIATPVYHDSFSGILKNALDMLYLEETADRLAGLISVGGGRFGHGQALEHLRAVLREMGTWVLPRQVLVTDSNEAFREDGTLKQPEMEQRLTLLGQELVLRLRAMRLRRK